jgi:hypothetical protein
MHSMRYVIIDPEGATRASFGSLREVREWAQAVKEQDLDLLDELVLMTYDAAGDEVANQWLSDFVPDIAEVISIAAVDAAVRSFLLRATPAFAVSATPVGSSEMAASTTGESPHRHTSAIETRSHAQAEPVAG